MAFARAVATVGGLTAASRVLGFARDVLIAALLGAGPAADAFFIAFKLPNLFRRLFAEGAFSAAFVPLFAGLVATRGRAAAERFAEQSLAWLVGVLLGVTLAAELAMPAVMVVLAPGFVGDPVRFGLAVGLGRITFPYLLFVALAALLAGMLNALGRFAAAAAAPILLNLVMIAAVLGLAPQLGDAARALAWGVLAAGMLQFLWLVGAARRAGLALRLPRPRPSPTLGRLLRLIGPGALGAGAVQISLAVNLILASLLAPGAVSYLYYADRLVQLPLGVVGAAIATALLPALARELGTAGQAGAHARLNRALEGALALTLPAAAGLIVLAQPIVAVLFERGAFGAAAAAATGDALAAFALGLPAYVLVRVLAPACFARADTATPVAVALVALAFNLALNLVLLPRFGHVGIALATAGAGWLNAGLLALALARRGRLAPDRRLCRRGLGLAGAAAVMAAAVALGRHGLAPVLAGPALARGAALAGLIAGGAAVFVAGAQLAGALDAAELWRALRHGDAAPAA
ncbi:MAG TPA: murein biosynthesis integral membrane protein MurJ [Candidatus Sulfotelmatobacter sp.]|nr:murein biosynthesis integral membrane protein MurJ [Candidatus Sulfotelmatobacter sp.]